MVDKIRCAWGEGSQIYRDYHDEDWGVPVLDDQRQFEFLVLESAQAGLSWITILKKRENYRKAYDDFDFNLVAKYDATKIEELLNNAGIIRNRLKVLASVNNAQCFLKIREEFGSFCNYIWKFVDNKPIVNKWKTMDEMPAKTTLSEMISKDLKKRGFKFLGPVIIYSHLQATGLINDHLVDCFRWSECQK